MSPFQFLSTTKKAGTVSHANMKLVFMSCEGQSSPSLCLSGYELTGLARGGEQLSRLKRNYARAVELLVELASLQVGGAVTNMLRFIHLSFISHFLCVLYLSVSILYFFILLQFILFGSNSYWLLWRGFTCKTHDQRFKWNFPIA